jgi:hypothetical protein
MEQGKENEATASQGARRIEQLPSPCSTARAAGRVRAAAEPGAESASACVDVAYWTMSFPLSRGTSDMTQREMAQQEESREPVKKTPAEHLANTLAQLKEMRHYSKNNVEHLTATWMLFDGELSKLKRTDKIEDLMNRQGQLHDALEAAIADLEEDAKKLQPPPAAAE